MTSVLLIYPYFKPRFDRSVFRFPPLGVAYLAAVLQDAGHEVHLLDCTFLTRDNALKNALAMKADVIGIYCMVSMMQECIWFATQLREHCQLLVTGGPLPTFDPYPFLEYFDVIVQGEGEQTMKELIQAFVKGAPFSYVAGIVFRKEKYREDGVGQDLIFTSKRAFAKDLDQIPFPARELLPNDSYIKYGKKKYGYSITTVMSTRGCPYHCEFCSNVVFGSSYRERSPQNVVDEIEETLKLGYERISFTDDVFTLKRDRVMQICQEIIQRKLQFKWECLGRVDALDFPTALEMKKAGCSRIFFGIESGNDEVLRIMNKNITTSQARKAVEIAHEAGLQVGAFFILGYPGDTNNSALDTLHFATSLPLDYLGLSMPYPLPGTALLERVKEQVTHSWHPVDNWFTNQTLIFDADFSESKMWFGILKGYAQFRIRKRLGLLAPWFLGLFEKSTDSLFRFLK